MSSAIADLEKNLFDLEKQLRDMPNARRELVDKVKAIGQSAQQSLDQGLSEDESLRVKKILAATRSACLVLEQVWYSYHPD